MVFFKAEVFAEHEVVRCIQKRLQIEAAENAREHFGFPNPSRKIKLRHRAGGAEEMVGDFGGVTFGGGENKIGERALKISERRAMDVMDDDGHAGARRRK